MGSKLEGSCESTEDEDSSSSSDKESVASDDSSASFDERNVIFEKAQSVRKYEKAFESEFTLHCQNLKQLSFISGLGQKVT